MRLCVIAFPYLITGINHKNIQEIGIWWLLRKYLKYVMSRQTFSFDTLSNNYLSVYVANKMLKCKEFEVSLFSKRNYR